MLQFYLLVVEKICRFRLNHNLVNYRSIAGYLFLHLDIRAVVNVLAAHDRHQLRIQKSCIRNLTNQKVGVACLFFFKMRNALMLNDRCIKVIVSILRAYVADLRYHILAWCIVIKKELFVVRQRVLLLLFRWAVDNYSIFWEELLLELIVKIIVLFYFVRVPEK